MPIYEYECTQCRERFEMRQSFDEDRSKVTCPKCGAPNPKRRFSVSSAQPLSQSKLTYIPGGPEGRKKIAARGKSIAEGE